MSAFYNEIDPFAADWLENLIGAGLIAPGIVDRRSIADIQPGDLDGFEQCHFFAGIGGWSYALRLAGVPDDRPLWTGSCPCQPFSGAGKLGRFADDRHLWPTWVRLIEKRRPAIVFGEQVASATEWLRLVRGDLEALGYAVGCAAIEAASAGADHLRDRYWFVADADQEREHGRGQKWGRRTEPPNSSGVCLADADDTRSQGRLPERERTDQRPVGADGLAYSDKPCASEEREQRSGQLGWPGSDQGARDGRLADSRSGRFSRAGEGEIQQPRRTEAERAGDSGDMGDAGLAAGQWDARGVSGSQAQERGEDWPINGDRSVGPPDAGPSAFEWVTGADGKQRRVKPGVRLLVNGFPNRVGLLRGFGNAIDPRPASAFIQASLEAMTGSNGP